jgi:hypothetical protein
MASAHGRVLKIVGQWLHLQTPEGANIHSMIASLIDASHKRWLDGGGLEKDCATTIESSGDTLENHDSTAAALNGLRGVSRDCRDLPARRRWGFDLLAAVLRAHQLRWRSPSYDPWTLVPDFLVIFYRNNERYAFRACWRGARIPAYHCPRSRRKTPGRCHSPRCLACYPVDVSIRYALLLTHRAVAALRRTALTEDRGIIQQTYRGLVMLGDFFEGNSIRMRKRVDFYFSPAKRRYAETMQALAASICRFRSSVVATADIDAFKNLDMDAYITYHRLLMTP